MVDPALSSLGAQIVLAASSDENHPPENIIDGSTETFWMSTGMFPQEFIIRLAESMKIALVTMHCYNVKTLKIEKSISDDATDFEAISEKGKQSHSTDPQCLKANEVCQSCNLHCILFQNLNTQRGIFKQMIFH
uniref:Heat shock protein, alpha-crystallin-related, b11 n=1 Tax=Hucho hucho TaxID=62062 RepID=A0A4W5P8E6_9TELE